MLAVDHHSNYSLLIQGPILSSGRTGITAFDQTITKDSIVDYRCENNIVELLTNFSHLFKKVYILTWADEQLVESDFEKFKNCIVLKLPNTPPVPVVGNKKLPTDFNNKYKQFYALSKGLEQIEGDEYVIKVRTDQYLDIETLINEHQAAIKEDERNIEKIFLPFISIINYSPSDMYFAATRQTLSDFANAMLWGNYMEFNSSVHLDMSLKYAYLHHRNKLKIPIKTYFLNSFDKNNNQDKVKLRVYLSNHVYHPFSSDIFEKTKWRGDMMTANKVKLNSYIFSNKNTNRIWNKKRYKKSTFIDFLYINIPSYLIVKYPSIKNTFVESFIKKGYKILKNILKKS